jgi:hypothetical protein
MTEFADNRFQKVPSKEKVNNTAEKIKSDFFKMGIEIHKNPWQFALPEGKHRFLFMSSMNPKTKSIEVSMTTIDKRSRTMMEEITINYDKSWFTISEKKSDANWNTQPVKQTKLSKVQDLLPYLNIIQKRFAEFQQVQNQEKMILVETSTRKEADILLAELNA